MTSMQPNILGYEAHTQAGRWLINRAVQTRSVQRLTDRYSTNATVTRTLTAIGSRPASSRQAVDLSDASPDMYQARPAPISPLDSSKAAANEALNNIQARMQDAVVQRDQAIRNSDVVKEKIENQKLGKEIENSARFAPVGDQPALMKAGNTIATSNNRSEVEVLVVKIMRPVIQHTLVHAILGGSIVVCLAAAYIHAVGNQIQVFDQAGQLIDGQGVRIDGENGPQILYDDPNDGDFLPDHIADLAEGPNGNLVHTNIQEINNSDIMNTALEQGGNQASELFGGIVSGIGGIFGF